MPKRKKEDGDEEEISDEEEAGFGND